MSKLLSLPLLALALLALAPEAAMAHSGHATGGFSLGFMHPLGGLDHVLAMVAVGLFAWHLGGKALWLVPTAFVATMAVGGAVGMAGTGLPLVEVGIALSIVVIGGLVALRRTMPTEIAMTVVAVFALFHGQAHGAEMGQAASGLFYGLGFLLATSLLHGAGILTGATTAQLSTQRGVAVCRASGAAIATAGVLILSGAI
jgi:urease accessory protein